MLHNRIFTPLLVTLAVVAASCGAGTQIAAISTGKPVSASDPALASFRDAGCAACHGQNGQGGIGPAMGGHTAEQVIRQVRAPLGAMPLFTPAELNDAQLASIVDFVTALPQMSMAQDVVHDEGGGAESGGLGAREVLIGHHWMAISAIDAGKARQAIAHITNINDLVQAEHQSAMNEVVDLLESGDLDSARAATLEMLAGFFPEEGSIDVLHLQLAAQALAVDSPTEAVVHLGRVGEGDSAEVAQSAIEALSAGQTETAAEILGEALGGEDHADDGGGEEADADHDG